MPSNSYRTGTLIHVRKLSLRQQLRESKAILVVFAFLFLLGIFYGGVAPLVLFTIGTDPPALIAASFALICFGVFSALLLRNAERGIDGKLKKTVLEIEDRLRKGTSPDVLADLDKITSLNLKLKRPEMADFYSRKAYEIAQAGPDSRPPAINDQMEVTFCHLSHANYQNTWRYCLVWLFETTGTLYLRHDSLLFTGAKYNMEIKLADIAKVELKRHPIWQRPLPLRYIALTFFENGQEHCYHLSPGEGMCDALWDINKKVDCWFGKLAAAQQSARKALLETDDLTLWS